MKSLKRFIGYRTLKTAAGAALAVFLSQILGLEYAVNSGIIVILTIQSTKKKSWDLAAQRLLATVAALTAGAAVFHLFGFYAWSFGIYLAFFIPLAARFGWYDAIVPCSVLVSHLLAVRSAAPAWLLNEFLQMVIGAGTGLLMNIHIPSVERELKADLALVDANMSRVLHDMASCLRNPQEVDPDPDLADQLDQSLHRGSALVEHELFNYPHGRAAASQSLLDLKRSQFKVLQHMGRYLHRIKIPDACCLKAADLTDLAAKLLSQTDEAMGISAEFESCRRSLWTGPMPATRDEVRGRASLHEYLNDLELLLDLKRNLSSEPFWPGESRQDRKK